MVNKRGRPINKGIEFKIKKVGPIQDLKIELGDITMLLGRPNSGKSYTLRSMYWFLQILDEKAQPRLSEKIGISYDFGIDVSNTKHSIESTTLLYLDYSLFS